MLDGQLCQICYPLEIKLSLTDFFLLFYWGGGGIKPGKKPSRRRKIAHPSKPV